MTHYRGVIKLALERCVGGALVGDGQPVVSRRVVEPDVSVEGMNLEANRRAVGTGQAAACFERARALGYEDDALLLLREAAAACPDAKRALAEAGKVWRTAGGRLSWGPESRRYDPRRLDVVVSGERDVDVDAGWRLDARASTKSALVWRREGETVWWVRARRPTV